MADARAPGVEPEAFDLVPAALLEPPSEALHPSCRTDAGLVLDRELVALSGVDARCRLIRARILAQIIARKTWRALGFVRLGDFARERLGVSPRSLEQDAHVVRALESLPAMAAHLESGRLTWTRARILVRIATTANEVVLLRDSANVAYRDLEQWVRDFASSEASAAGTPAEATPAKATLGGTPGGTPGGALEGVTESVAGDSDAGAAVDASGASITGQVNAGTSRCSKRFAPECAADDPIVRWSIKLSRSGRRIWRAASEYASRSAGSPLSPGQVLELVAAEASAAVTASADRWIPSPEEHERRLRSGLRARVERGRRFLLGFLAETGVAEGFPWLAPNALSPGPAAALEPLSLGLEHADAFELERRFQVLRTVWQRTDAQIAALLRTGVDRRLFHEIGFASVKLYVESRLGMSARKAWSLVAIERESWRRSHLLHQAWKDGRLSQLRALALLPVLRSTNAEAWIQRAGEVTLRRLHDEVAWALDHGQSPCSVDECLPPPSDADVRLDCGGDVTLVEVQNRAHGPAADSSIGPPGAVMLDILSPVSIAVLAETTLDRLARPREARWQTFERMVALALLDWMTTPRHRDPVFERDGWRCAVPACSSRRNLHDHHVVFRSEGGGDSQDNRITVCASHHLHGIHAGIVRAAGRAPDDIRWEMGCASGREPAARFHGDRYAG